MPLAAFAAASPNVGYVQTNLVSNVPGAAKYRDPQALNSWGIVAGRAAVWVNQNHAGVTSGYGRVWLAASGVHHPYSGAGRQHQCSQRISTPQNARRP